MPRAREVRRSGSGAAAYPLATESLRLAGRVAMPRRPRLHASEGTVHVVGRCNNREFCFTTPADFHRLLAHLCAAYALGAPNPLLTLHPSYLGLSRYPKVRQRHYRALLAPSGDPRADARDPRWTTERAVGTAAFLVRYGLPSVPPGGIAGHATHNR
jgi:hypothetical protein